MGDFPERFLHAHPIIRAQRVVPLIRGGLQYLVGQRLMRLRPAQRYNCPFVFPFSYSCTAHPPNYWYAGRERDGHKVTRSCNCKARCTHGAFFVRVAIS